jgi:hypothetical protein
LVQLALATLLSNVVWLTALSGSAHAATFVTDTAWCGTPYWHAGEQRFVQRCPLWRGAVPVYSKPTEGRVVGYLWKGGWANWFAANKPERITQFRGPRIDVGGRWSTWWILTRADNGARGWVNEAYFAGNGNDQPDAGIGVY